MNYCAVVMNTKKKKNLSWQQRKYILTTWTVAVQSSQGGVYVY